MEWCVCHLDEGALHIADARSLEASTGRCTAMACVPLTASTSIIRWLCGCCLMLWQLPGPGSATDRALSLTTRSQPAVMRLPRGVPSPLVPYTKPGIEQRADRSEGRVGGCAGEREGRRVTAVGWYSKIHLYVVRPNTYCMRTSLIREKNAPRRVAQQCHVNSRVYI